MNLTTIALTITLGGVVAATLFTMYRHVKGKAIDLQSTSPNGVFSQKISVFGIQAHAKIRVDCEKKVIHFKMKKPLHISVKNIAFTYNNNRIYIEKNKKLTDVLQKRGVSLDTKLDYDKNKKIVTLRAKYMLLPLSFALKKQKSVTLNKA